MNETKFNPRAVILISVILLVSIIRVAATFSDNFKDIANFSGIGAIALFGGAYFKSSLKAFGLPLLILLLSDSFIANTSGYGFFYDGWYWTYIAFILMTVVGRFMLKKVTVQSVTLSTVAMILIHWIISDISAMYVPGLYPPTLAGYWTCLVAAIPYELNFIYGSVIYGVLMFGGFELAKMKFPALNFEGSTKIQYS